MENLVRAYMATLVELLTVAGMDVRGVVVVTATEMFVMVEGEVTREAAEQES